MIRKILTYRLEISTILPRKKVFYSVFGYGGPSAWSRARRLLVIINFLEDAEKLLYSALEKKLVTFMSALSEFEGGQP